MRVRSCPNPFSPSPLHPSSASRKFGPDPSRRTRERAICNDQKPDSRGRPASSERVQGHPKYFYGPVRSMYPRLERAPAPTPGCSFTSTPSASHTHPHPLPIPSSILQFTSSLFFPHHALRVPKRHVVYESVVRFLFHWQKRREPLRRQRAHPQILPCLSLWGATMKLLSRSPEWAYPRISKFHTPPPPSPSCRLFSHPAVEPACIPFCTGYLARHTRRRLHDGDSPDRCYVGGAFPANRGAEPGEQVRLRPKPASSCVTASWGGTPPSATLSSPILGIIPR